MGSEEAKDPLKGVDWKAIGSELQKDPTASNKPVIKKRLPKKIRQIPDCYFLPRMPTPSTIAFYGAYVAGGIGAGMLLEVWINNKIKGVRSRMRLASLTRNTAQQQRIGIAFQRQKQRVRLLSLQKSLGLMLLLFVLLSYWGHFCSEPSMLVVRGIQLSGKQNSKDS
ncbi:hypothetical protein ES319_D05G292300v1 [Gossypium barbadense]|uniref:Uncharacterized protein n=3 Tax=Gossypium TaxID=3633 RepID=A0A5J5RJ18_GOSBA|nr:hypothetical protein ES319_D05G292300v1 [Gossypium barbadense]KAB2031253.1 hypothetical protein ES319_D05G292300v1 [Gossypium barbadense]TYG70370.1 hypothetical protein ES288_D05G307900v1 [Gossypium darwinii]TYH73142.1 hypothetical protein ES332_D05G308000v1 [Gossypium tomentosum]